MILGKSILKRKDNMCFSQLSVKNTRLNFLFTLVFSLSTFLSFSQRHTSLSKSELGIMGGGSFYIGDLNPYQPFRNSKWAFGGIFRYNIHSRTVFRINATYGQVEAYDKGSKSQLLQNRNLNFNSKIYEVATGIEFNYFPFEIGHQKYKGSAYILAEIGLFRMNPTTQYNGETVELQPLGTEGQGSVLSKRSNYNLTQVCIPLGLGAKLTLWGWGTINVEMGIRKTFTDYLDDVHNDGFIDAEQLAITNGPKAAALSNRNLDGARYGKRGTSSNNDWYVFSGVMLTFKLGPKTNCFFKYK
jgi:hypothetical protein